MAKAKKRARSDSADGKSALTGKTKTAEPAIRPATQDDLKAILGIYNWAINQTFATIDSEPLDAEEAQEWWEMHGRRSKLGVAVDETGGIGWGRRLPVEPRGFEVDESLVYVYPVDQGRGPGAALLTEMIREARGLGYLTIVASIAKDNRAGLALYTKHGFSVVGTIHNAAHKFDRWRNTTLIKRPRD